MKNRLVITLSFDDGRRDTYDYAYKIMKKYNIVGTLHVISGYIDGTWNESGMDTSYGACNIDMLKEMKNYGIEISLHGDKHTTEKEDLKQCIKKLKKWKLIDDNYGFSVPYSNEKLLYNESFQKYLKESNISYVRVGKNLKKLSFLRKAYYALYDITKIYFFYKNYNLININNLNKLDRMHILSIPVKNNDRVKDLQRFINYNLKTNNWLIFMFHSILPVENKYFGKDKWAWSTENFETLCRYLSELRDKKKIEIDTIVNISR